MTPVLIFLGVIGCYGTVAYVTHRLTRILPDKWDDDREAQKAVEDRKLAIAEREVAVKERAIAVTEQNAGNRPSNDAIPADLQARITAWEDGWAQEGEEGAIRSLYAKYGDWNVVRQNLHALPIRNDNQPDGMIQGTMIQ